MIEERGKREEILMKAFLFCTQRKQVGFEESTTGSCLNMASVKKIKFRLSSIK